MSRLSRLFIAFLATSTIAFAQQAANKPRENPYGCLDVAKGKSLEWIRLEIQRLKRIAPKSANTCCEIAELMKRVGDYDAQAFYKDAIIKQDVEPAYELFLADYLRNFRGAQHPLFPEAERRYFKAKEKLKQIKERQSFDLETERRVERGLIALFQEDGLPLLYRKSHAFDPIDSPEQPFWFLASINKYSEMLGDFDRVDEVRSFTSEALFASSRFRLNRPLTKDELEGIIRTKPQYETLNRFRFRYKRMPALDLFYKYRTVEDAQITDFFEPNRFNDVSLHEYGVAAEKPLSVASQFDLFLRGSIKRLDRKGIVEVLPGLHEDINQYEGNVVFSKFAGPDRVSLEYSVVYQDINEGRSDTPRRTRTIQGGRFTYQVFRPIRFLQAVYENRFETRGIDLFAGFLHDRESFGQVDVTHKDYFFGTSIKGIGSKGRADISVQPTILTSNVEGDHSQDNSQFRTNVALLYRIVDEERSHEMDTTRGMLHLAFLHLVVPVKHDLAITGPDTFENFRIGIELSSKVFTVGKRRTTFLLSARYDYQRFFNLNLRRNLLGFSLGMGF